jgi:hypothetical protein
MKVVAIDHVQLAMPVGMEARKAHPAMLVEDLGALIAHLQSHSVDVLEDVPLDGSRRVHIADPFGNRIGLIAAAV